MLEYGLWIQSTFSGLVTYVLKSRLQVKAAFRHARGGAHGEPHLC